MAEAIEAFAPEWIVTDPQSRETVEEFAGAANRLWKRAHPRPEPSA